MDKKIFMYDYFRNQALSKIVGNLGKVVESDDKIICYVDENKIKRKKSILVIDCSKKEELCEKYNINKPIYYILEGININENKKLFISGSNCNVIIRNCNFNIDTSIYIEGKCILDNTYIKSFFITPFYAHELIIKNMNRRIEDVEPNLVMAFSARDKISVIDSNVGQENCQNSIFFNSKNEINFINSKISGDIIKCTCKKIIMDNTSYIISKNKVYIESKTSTLKNITSP